MQADNENNAVVAEDSQQEPTPDTSEASGTIAPPPPDLAKPGLAVDLTRRLTAADLRGCFQEVTPLGTLTRGEAGEPGKAYAVFRVAGPTRDVLARGCWSASGSTSGGGSG